MSLEEIRKETKKEQEKYKKYNQGFLTSWADRADIYKKISKLVQPYFEKMLDAVVDFCLDIRKDMSNNILMGNTINKMIDVLNDYCDATDKIEEKENNTSFYEDNEDVGIDDPKKFYLSDKSINEINSGNVYVDFDNIIVEKDNFATIKVETINNRTKNIQTYTYTINRDVDGYFMMICLEGYTKDSVGTENFNPEWSTLVLQGLPNNQIEILEARDSKNPNVIDFGDIINHIFIDSDIYVVDEKDTCDSKISYYSDKINSLESLKKYFKDQGKEVNSGIDEGIEYYKKQLKWAEEDEEKCRNKKCEITPEESSAIDTMEQAIKEAEEIIKNNAES
jgi:hypothetical protein